MSRSEPSEIEKQKLLESQYPNTIERAKHAEANVSAVLQSIKQVRIVGRSTEWIDIHFVFVVCSSNI